MLKDCEHVGEKGAKFWLGGVLSVSVMGFVEGKEGVVNGKTASEG